MKKSKLIKKYKIYIRELREQKGVVFFAFCLLLALETVFLQQESDLILFLFLLIYILGIILLKFSPRNTFIILLLLTAIMAVAYVFSGTSLIAEKAAVWLFLFLCINVVQLWKN